MNITLKNVPSPLHRRLRARADRHRRSLNSEALACLESVVMAERVDGDAILTRARDLRRRVRDHLTERDLRSLKNQGRP